MSSVSKKTGVSKKAARDRAILAKARKQDGAEKPVSEAQIKKAAERAGIDQIPRLNAPDLPDEHGETRATRQARFDDQRRILACTVPDSLAGLLRRLLSQGQWVEPEAPDPDNHNSMAVSGEHALARVAAIQVKAIALALEGGVRGESALDSDMELTVEEAAYALVGVATTLELGMVLIDDMRCAKNSQAVAS